MRHFLKTHYGVLALAVLAMGGRTVRADLAPVYDLDSLVFLSSDVVEGTVVGMYDDVEKKWESGAVVRVDGVLAGGLKKGGNIKVMGLMSYRKTLDEKKKWEKGDRVWLFLETPAAARGEKPGAKEAGRAEEAGMYVPISSGVRLVEGERVLAPKQWSNPGPYVMVPPGAGAVDDATFPLVAKFSELVDGSVNKITGLRARLAKPVGAGDEGWVLRMLKERNPKRALYWDPISKALALRLAGTHDLDMLVEVMESPNLTTAEVAFGFGSPEGRELLIKKLGDGKLSAQVKLRYVEAVRLTGVAYGMTAELEAKEGSATWTWSGKDVEGNGRYLQRLAAIATDKGLDKGVAEKLRGTIRGFGNYGFGKFAEAQGDWVKACEISR